MDYNQYDNPLITRYASSTMSALFSPQRKFSTWRRLWVALAETEMELGLPITQEQVDELRSQVDNIDFDAAAEYEKKFRHDVMAHNHAFGDVCPNAKGIIHWGATSCYVTDNTDCILAREAMQLVRARLVDVLRVLGKFALENKDLACLGFTHLQPAQPTTIGKRATLWMYDLTMDLEDLEHRLATIKTRGAKGTTGTQASFLDIFEGDHEKVRELDRRVCKKMGFDEPYAVTG